MIPEASELEIQLIEGMLIMDPNKRMSLQEILNSKYFDEAENFDKQQLGDLVSKM